MPFQSYREQSRINWGRDVDVGGILSRDEVQHGALLRIADAAEAMAKNHNALLAECDRYERWFKKERDRANRLQKSNAALRGYAKMLKRHLETIR